MSMLHVICGSNGRLSRTALHTVLLLAVLCACGMSAASTQAAVSIEYPNFSNGNVSALQLNGAAQIAGPILRLTPAKGAQQSSAFYTTPIDPSQAWSTQFEISMYGNEGGVGPADGIVFVLQNDPRGTKAVLSSSESTEGGALGYSGINPSLGLEFDIYDRNQGDPFEAKHIGIIENGDPSKYVECATEGTVLTPCDKSFNFPLYSALSTPVVGWMTYDGANRLTVYANKEASKPATPLLQVEVNLGSLLGKSAFAGFTAATGGGNAIQEVRSWNFSGSVGIQGTPPKESPSPNNGLVGTATQVICNLVIATASDTCTATVGGAATFGNPTGAVKFTSTNGGVFSAGNSCNLVPTPFSGSVSSCSVQFLPPTNPSSLPAITASYLGDAHHNPSSGQTSYGSANSLSGYVEISSTATTSPNGKNVELPISCQFPCQISGELTSRPQFPAETASFAGFGASKAVLARAKKPSKKRKKVAKSVLLGKGSLTLSAPGKGTLVVKLNAKAKRALTKAKGRAIKGILTATVQTANGTLVKTEKKTITIRPAVKKHKKSKRSKRH